MNRKGRITGLDDESRDYAEDEDRNQPEVKFRLDAIPENVRVARELADVVLLGWALRHLMEPARLIVSELFTNALDATPGGDVFLLFAREAASVSIGLWDSSPAMPIAGACDPGDESGRGLHIVAALADDHGAYPVRRPNGKLVWARLNT
ncbi:ATP-binding protein [Actinomadura alba]|uniref:ATP-binding protein n=1 Tax=Actinomadura alba TaxID=406431 RepID=A0ABR7LLA1_9ACTN|nr:ATP-binding protein [Actinomadura alba]MBC6465148.1 ATP-binding protein [Actinomadura alba]